jgi:uncharacterized protein involved in exopolysaccharide biosynthesis
MSTVIAIETERSIDGDESSVMAMLERRWRVIACAAVLGAALGGALARVLPPWFEANAKLAIIPVEDPTTAGGINVIDGTNATLPILVAVLRSRVVAEQTVARLGLQAAWGAPSADAARARLLAQLTINTDRKSNIVMISVEDRDPARAQAIAETAAEVARARANDLWAARGRAQRHQLEADLADVDAQLRAAEDAMRAFRERTGIVDLPAQTRATVEQAAALEKLRIEKALALRFARAFGGAGAVEVQRAVEERDGAARELEALRAGGRAPLLPLGGLPALEEEYTRNKRAVDLLTARHELLALKQSQLLAAEAKPGGRAELVDPPVTPHTRSRPSTIGLSGQGAGVAAVLAALVLIGARQRRRARAR